MDDNGAHGSGAAKYVVALILLVHRSGEYVATTLSAAPSPANSNYPISDRASGPGPVTDRALSKICQCPSASNY
jgi:hypothetical protein